MKRQRLPLFALLVASAMAMASSPAPRDLEWSPALTALESPTAGASAQPQLSVSSRGVLLSWIEREDARATLKFTERTTTGWSQAVTVASGDDWFVNWADVPSVVRLADGTLAAHWLQKSGPGTYAYDVRLAYSTDEGRTWSPSFLPHDDGTKTEHGFASLFQLPGAGLGLVWLDGRAMAGGSGPDSKGKRSNGKRAEDKHAQGKDAHGKDTHGPGARGAMSVRFASFDSSWKQSTDMPVDLRVCECCPTAAVLTSDGPLVAFRDRSDDDVRDIHVSRFERGAWSEPHAVHDDGWKIPACPVNGPALSARGRDVAIAWFTVKDEIGHAFAAFSRDAGRTFGAPIRLDDRSSLGRVDIELLSDGPAVATWIEFVDQRAQIRARRVDASGATSKPLTVAAVESGRTSGYPRVARHGNDLVFAWTENQGGQMRVRTAVAR